jgi:hypothetical protein
MILTAEDSSPGVINGRVINKTLDNKGMGGLEVIIQAYVEGKKPDVHRTITDPSGFFSFEQISTDQNVIYHLSTKYKNIEYFSQEMPSQEKNELPVDISVYETTNQNNNILIKMHHIFLEKNNDSFRINEAVIVENRGDRVYVGTQEVQPGVKQTLRISLPNKASNLQFDQHVAPFIVNTAEGFVDTSAIKPGTKRILFSYTVDSTDLNYIFTKDLHQQTDNLTVVFPDQGFKIKSDQLDLKDSITNSGRQFYNLSGKNFEKGSRVAIEFNSIKNDKLFQWVVLGMLILLVTIGLLIPLIKRGDLRQITDRQTPFKDQLNLPDQRQAILKAIAQLDDRAESSSGDIDTDGYLMERADLLIKVKDLSKRLEGDKHISTPI